MISKCCIFIVVNIQLIQSSLSMKSINIGFSKAAYTLSLSLIYLSTEYKWIIEYNSFYLYVYLLKYEYQT